MGLIKRSWLESGAVYGYRKVTTDLGERCSRHRVARLMKLAGLRAQAGYGRRLKPRGALPATLAPKRLQRQFTVDAPNTHWVAYITHIRTHEGWVFLAVVFGLFSRCSTTRGVSTEAARGCRRWSTKSGS
jgi:putative transposase